MRRSLSIALVPALALSACSVSETSEEDGGTDAENTDLTPEGPSMLSNVFGGGEPMPLDIQEAHPNRTVLRLTSLQVKPSETVISATVSNGRDRKSI